MAQPSAMKQEEIEALESMNRIGSSALYNSRKASESRKTAMKDPETKKAVYDFIFSGKDADVESPLDSIHKDSKKRTENLKNKKLSGSITGVHNK